MAEYKKGANDRNYGIFIVNDMAIALAHIVMVGKPYEAPVKRTKDDEEEAVKMWLINVYMTGVRDPLKVFCEKEDEAKDCYFDMLAALETFHKKDVIIAETIKKQLATLTWVYPANMPEDKLAALIQTTQARFGHEHKTYEDQEDANDRE